MHVRTCTHVYTDVPACIHRCSAASSVLKYVGRSTWSGFPAVQCTGRVTRTFHAFSDPVIVRGALILHHFSIIFVLLQFHHNYPLSILWAVVVSQTYP